MLLRRPRLSGVKLSYLWVATQVNPEFQSQLEISSPPAATQLILMNVCFMDYAYSISCYLSRFTEWVLNSVTSGLQLKRNQNRLVLRGNGTVGDVT